MSNSASKSAPRLAVSCGEPAGIGPDLLIDIAQRPREREIIAVGSATLLRQRAEALNLPLEIVRRSEAQLRAAEPLPCQAGALAVLDLAPGGECAPGELNPDNAALVMNSLRAACELCAAGLCQALVTAPVHKGHLNAHADPEFMGHTEHLARLFGVERPVMMLVVDDLRVALATTHLPLREVPDAIREDDLLAVLRVMRDGLRDCFGVAEPRILVAGLNPHAGEGGALGDEDAEVIAPAVARAAADGLRVEGPLPADTLFTPARLRDADAVLAMYHDQGLPPLKRGGFGRAVNITLGLPFIRTSVDHGTALDLAGRGGADSGSLAAAIDCAFQIIGRVGS